MNKVVALSTLIFALLVSCGPDEMPKNYAVTVVSPDDVKGGEYQFSYIGLIGFSGKRMAETALTPQELGLLKAVNAARARGGTCVDAATGSRQVFASQPALQLEEHVVAAAREHAQSMAKYSYFNHMDRYNAKQYSPVQRLFNAGYLAVPRVENAFVFENLARSQETGEQVVAEWLTQSFSHCTTVFANAQYIGVGYQDGYWVADMAASGR